MQNEVEMRMKENELILEMDHVHVLQHLGVAGIEELMKRRSTVISPQCHSALMDMNSRVTSVWYMARKW